MIWKVAPETDRSQAAEKEAKSKKQATKQATVTVGQGKKADDVFGIVAKKDVDFPSWYQEVVLKAEMIEYYNEVSSKFTGAHGRSCAD